MGSVLVCFKLPNDMLDMIDHLAEKRGVSRSEIIREAIRAYLSGEPEVRRKPKIRIRHVVLD